MLRTAFALTGASLVALGLVSFVAGAVMGHREPVGRSLMGFGLVVLAAFLIALAGAY